MARCKKFSEAQGVLNQTIEAHEISPEKRIACRAFLESIRGMISKYRSKSGHLVYRGKIAIEDLLMSKKFNALDLLAVLKDVNDRDFNIVRTALAHDFRTTIERRLRTEKACKTEATQEIPIQPARRQAEPLPSAENRDLDERIRLINIEIDAEKFDFLGFTRAAHQAWTTPEGRVFLEALLAHPKLDSEMRRIINRSKPLDLDETGMGKAKIGS